MRSESNFNKIRPLCTYILYVFLFNFYFLDALAQPIEKKQRIVLVVFVEGYPMSQRAAQANLDFWRQIGMENVRSIWLSKEDVVSLETESSERILSQKISEILKLTNNVYSLVIFTHGSSDLSKNETQLRGLGGFGPEGSFGAFDLLINILASHLSDSLHICFLGCSTYCGSRDQIGSRIAGLYRKLSQVGVKHLSTWGATEPLV